jgi:hypothetical protein
MGQDGKERVMIPGLLFCLGFVAALLIASNGDNLRKGGLALLFCLIVIAIAVFADKPKQAINPTTTTTIATIATTSPAMQVTTRWLTSVPVDMSEWLSPQPPAPADSFANFDWDSPLSHDLQAARKSWRQMDLKQKAAYESELQHYPDECPHLDPNALTSACGKAQKAIRR